MKAVFFGWLFWGSSALILYTYAVYPLWLCLRARCAARPWKREPITPSVSIVMAVHNGVASIAQQITRLLDLDYPAELVEIITVSDGSTDGTAELLRSMAQSRVRAFICDEHQGKAAALNLGMRNARHDLLVFVDVRPRLERDALRELVSNFADPKVGCAGGNLILPRSATDAATAAVGGFYWRYEQAIRSWESRIDSTSGVAGALYAVRRSLAVQLPAGLILDDMFQPLSVVRQGYRAVIDSKARISDGMPSAAGEFRRKVRTLAGNFQLVKLAPFILGNQNRLRWQLISHKLLRLAVPTLLAAAGISSAVRAWDSRFYLGGLVAQVAFYGCALLGQAGILRKWMAVPAGFVLLNAAAVVGFWKFVANGDSNDLWKIWATPARAIAAETRLGPGSVPAPALKTRGASAPE